LDSTGAVRPPCAAAAADGFVAVVACAVVMTAGAGPAVLGGDEGDADAAFTATGEGDAVARLSDAGGLVARELVVGVVVVRPGVE
jgi:hypothetical protein